MAITLLDLARLRGKRQTLRPVLNKFPTQVIATAVISVTPTAYPVGSVEVTSTSGWSNVRVGQAYKITASNGDLVTYGIVRLTPGTTTFYIDGKSRGDAGIAARFIYALESGQTITVYSLEPLWTLFSRIQNGIFYKRFDQTYVDEGSNPTPVCNIGSWRQANAFGGVARLNFSAADSFAWLGKTITSVSWTAPSGATYTDGGSTSTDIELELPEGFHILRCQVTDSGGKTQGAMRPIWINGPSYKSLSDSAYAFQISSDNQDRQGRQAQVTLWGTDLDEDVVFPGTGFLLTENAIYDGQALNPGVGVDTFVGFSVDRTLVYHQQTPTLSLNLLSPYHVLTQLPMVSQVLVEKSSGISTWTDVAEGLGRPDFVVWYILKHHTPFLNLFDYSRLPEDNPPRKRRWALQGSTVAEYIDQAASIIGGNLGCKSDGTLMLRRDPNIEDTSFRSALEQRMTFTPDDLREQVEVALSHYNKVGQLKVYAFTYLTPDDEEATPLGSIAPGSTQAQAPGQSQEDSLIVIAENAQAVLNQIAGHMLARSNNPVSEVSLGLLRNMDVVDPATMKWFALNVPASYSSTGNALNWRILPTSVARNWSETNGTWTKEITVSAQPETFGQPGEKLDINRGMGYTEPPLYPPTQPPMVIDQIGGVLFAVDETNSNIGRSFDGIIWDNIFGGANFGIGLDLAINHFSSYSLSGYSSGRLDGWAAVYVSGQLKIYYSSDLLASTISWTQQTAFTVSDASAIQKTRIVSDKKTDGLVAVAWHEQSAMWAAYTENGATWGSAVQVGSSTNSDAIFSTQDFGLDVENGVIVLTGQDDNGLGVKYTPYYVVPSSTSYTAVADVPIDSVIPNPHVSVGEDGNMYTTASATQVLSYLGKTFNDLEAADFVTWSYTTSHPGYDTTISSADVFTFERIRLTFPPTTSFTDVSLEITFNFASPLSTSDIPGEQWRLQFIQLPSSRTYDFQVDMYDIDDDLLYTNTVSSSLANVQPTQGMGTVSGISKVVYTVSIASFTTSASGYELAVRSFTIGIFDENFDYVSERVHQVTAEPGNNPGLAEYDGYPLEIDGVVETDDSRISITTTSSGGGFIDPEETGVVYWSFGDGGSAHVQWILEFVDYPLGVRPAYLGGWIIEGKMLTNDVEPAENLELTLEIKDIDDNIILTETYNYDSFLLDTDYTMGTSGLPSGIYGAAHIDGLADLRYVKKIRCRIEMSDGGYTTVDGARLMLNSLYIFFQDETENFAGNGKWEGGFALYRVEDFTSGSPTWNDITPELGAPTSHNGFYFEPIGTTNSGAIVRTGVAAPTSDYVKTTTSGDTWTTVLNNTPYKSLIKVGRTAILYGEQVIDYTEDDGATGVSLLGNWQTAFGQIGTFSRVIVIV